MLRIIKIGMDVHTSNYTLYAIEPVLGEDEHVIMSADTTPEWHRKRSLTAIDCY